MSRHTLIVTLDSDVIFTAQGATVGRPDTLERVPGATLLGAAAGRLYSGLLPEEQLAAFHLARVRFGDGLPLAPDGTLGVPVPASWHQPKDDKGTVDLSQVPRNDQQLKQLRGSWVSPGGEGWLGWRVSTTESMRTAIDETGRAREGLLYGFVAIRAGARFTATVEGEDEALTQQVADSLCAAPIRVGRSRGTEFGRANVRKAADNLAELESNRAPRDGLVRALCLSDVALIDAATGMPRLVPSPADVGLPAGWRWDADMSFLRFRRYSPFNSTRARPDRERQVVAAGSVLTFTHAGAAAPLAEMRRHTAQGVGEYREAGLGRVLVEPKVLAKAHPSLRPFGVANEAPAATPSPSGALLEWALRRVEATETEQAIWEAAEEKAHEVGRWRISRSQWGVVRSLAAECASAAEPFEQLKRRWKATFEDGVAADAWGDYHKKLRRWTEDLLANGTVGPADAVRALQLLAARAPRHMGGHRE